MALAIRQRAWQPLMRRAEKRLPSLTRLRQREPLPIQLDRRRIYIMPTAFGLVFGAILMVMLVGALNYNNNAALLLTCVLAATCIVSMLQTFRNLDGLRLQAVKPGNTHAGQALQLELLWHARGRARGAIELHLGDATRHFDATEHGATRAHLAVSTRRRGWMPLPRIKVGTRWPFGWFRAWSWLAPTQKLLVYPRMETGGPPPPPRAGSESRQRRPHGDEWSGLRDYRSGDPRRHIAWKASARAQTLRVKTFDQPNAEQTWHLAWDSVRLTDREARISRLARWVDEAFRADRPWSLQLPQRSIGSGRGAQHYHRSMRALAELP